MKSQLKTLALACSSAFILIACASIQPNEVDSKLVAWQGSSIDTLIQTWGLPTLERDINGTKYAEWNTREIKRRPAVNIGIGGFGSHIFGSIGTTIFGGNKESHCTVQVGYNVEGRVISTNWNGDPDACDAAIPERAE
ncbi:MAG: hypothetical protein HWD86_06275 [Kangiellaceae bacterium]|nr:hypothetical protein [Kangiellaceae bacterium]